MRAAARTPGDVLMIRQDEKPFSFREMPEAYRPETRLAREGSQSLSDIELVSLVIGQSKKKSVQDVAGRVLSLGDTLFQTTVPQLTRIIGSRSKAVRFMAALELGRRLNIRKTETRNIIREPLNAVDVIKPHLQGADREIFAVILLNTKHHVIAVKIVSIGTLNSANVHPREVFKTAISHSSAAVILAHNHPSGDPTPSRQDIDLTNRLVEAGRVIDIEILDHLIIGDGRWVSMKADGLIS